MIRYDTNLFVTLQLIRLGQHPFQFSPHPSDNPIYVLDMAPRISTSISDWISISISISISNWISISISNWISNSFVTLESLRPGSHSFQFTPTHLTAKFEVSVR